MLVAYLISMVVLMIAVATNKLETKDAIKAYLAITSTMIGNDELTIVVTLIIYLLT